MRPAIAVALIVGGIVLIAFGINASDSIASDVSRFFTGNPTDRAMWFLVGGLVCVAAGIVAGATSPGILKRR